MIGYNIVVMTLYKPLEIKQIKHFCLHASFLLCAFKALYKLPEKILLYLFVKKLPIGSLAINHSIYITYLPGNPGLQIIGFHVLPSQTCLQTPLLWPRCQSLVESLGRFYYISRREGNACLLQLLKRSTGP